MLGIAWAFSAGFELPLLAALTSLSEPALLDAIDELLAAGLIRPADERRPGCDFAHALVRHALADEVDRDRRARLRRPVASARMTEARTDIDRAAVLRGPREVSEDEADAAVAGLYGRLRDVLGVPFIPTVFRTLAVHEDYLGAVVDAASATPPERRATYARRCVDLAAGVATELEPGPVSAGDATGAVAAVLERYNVANPAGLLILAALSEGLEPARVLEAPLPERADRSLQEDILVCHGGFTVPGLWRELAQGWPDVAERAWTEIRRLAGSPRFAIGRQHLLALASEALPAAAFPRPATARSRPGAADDVERIVTWFAGTIPTMVLEIECLRLALGSAEPRR